MNANPQTALCFKVYYAHYFYFLDSTRAPLCGGSIFYNELYLWSTGHWCSTLIHPVSKNKLKEEALKLAFFSLTNKRSEQKLGKVYIYWPHHFNVYHVLWESTIVTVHKWHKKGNTKVFNALFFLETFHLRQRFFLKSEMVECWWHSLDSAHCLVFSFLSSMCLLCLLCWLPSLSLMSLICFDSLSRATEITHDKVQNSPIIALPALVAWLWSSGFQ